MPITFVHDSELGIVRTQVEGPIGITDVLQHLERLRAAHLFASPELVDARNSHTNLSAADVRQLVDGLRGTDYCQGPRAIVARDDVSFGMARMFSILCDNFGAPVAVFRVIEPAVALLAKAVSCQPSAISLQP